MPQVGVPPFRVRRRVPGLQRWVSAAATMAAALQVAQVLPETRMPSSDLFRMFRVFGGLFSAANTLNPYQSSAARAAWRRVAVPGSMPIPGNPQDELKPHRGEKCPAACEMWCDGCRGWVEAAEAGASGPLA